MNVSKKEKDTWTLAPSVRTIRILTQEERYVVLLVRVAYREDNLKQNTMQMFSTGTVCMTVSNVEYELTAAEMW